MIKIIRLIKFIIAWFRIPKGQYCYKCGAAYTLATGRGTGRCPYWRRIKDRPSQANGWCDYLGKGDVEIAAETILTVVYVRDAKSDSKVGDKISGTDFPGGSLLWYQCKECGIKMED